MINTLNKCENDIVCFQEMHCISDYNRKIIEEKCCGNLYVNNGTTQSRGVATFIRNNDFIIQKGIARKDSCGRMIGVQIVHCGKMWCIVNLYAPNDSVQRHDFLRMFKKN